MGYDNGLQCRRGHFVRPSGGTEPIRAFSLSVLAYYCFHIVQCMLYLPVNSTFGTAVIQILLIFRSSWPIFECTLSFVLALKATKN